MSKALKTWAAWKEISYFSPIMTVQIPDIFEVEGA